MLRGRNPVKTLALRAAAQLLRLVPGSAALRWKRDLRDAAWLADADAVVISFPKSGRTFVRAMLARLFQVKFGIDERRLLDFPSLRRAAPAVPRLLFVHAGDAMREPDKIRINPADYAHREGCAACAASGRRGGVALSPSEAPQPRPRAQEARRAAAEAICVDGEGRIPSIVEYLNAWAKIAGTIVRYEDFLTEPEEDARRHWSRPWA